MGRAPAESGEVEALLNSEPLMEQGRRSEVSSPTPLRSSGFDLDLEGSKQSLAKIECALAVFRV